MLCGLLISLNGCFLFGGGGGESKNAKKMTKEEKAAAKKEAKAEEQFATTLEVGLTLKDAGKYEEALLIYTETIAQDSTTLVAARAMHEMGNVYLEMLDYEKAQMAYERVMQQFPAFEANEEVKKKFEFAKAAQQVRIERLKVAKEGPSMK